MVDLGKVNYVILWDILGLEPGRRAGGGGGGLNSGFE